LPRSTHARAPLLHCWAPSRQGLLGTHDVPSLHAKQVPVEGLQVCPGAQAPSQQGAPALPHATQRPAPSHARSSPQRAVRAALPSSTHASKPRAHVAWAVRQGLLGAQVIPSTHAAQAPAGVHASPAAQPGPHDPPQPSSPQRRSSHRLTQTSAGVAPSIATAASDASAGSATSVLPRPSSASGASVDASASLIISRSLTAASSVGRSSRTSLLTAPASTRSPSGEDRASTIEGTSIGAH
jgi:hypothetical protein